MLGLKGAEWLIFFVASLITITSSRGEYPPKDEYSCLKEAVKNDAEKVCFNETVQALEADMERFLDAAAWRGSATSNFHQTVRDLNGAMRRNYKIHIENTGKNIFPLIVATETDTPELSGIGGAYKVYFRNGTLRRIVPDAHHYALHKSLSHMVLAIYSILSPYFRAGPSSNWRGPLTEYSSRVNDVLAHLPSAGIPEKEMTHCQQMLTMTKEFMEKLLKEPMGSVTPKMFTEFGNYIAPLIEKSMMLAAKAQIISTLPALKQLKADMGEEWEKAYVIIPTIWPVSLFNVRLQVFRKLMGFKQLKQQVLIVEGARSEDDARETLGRIVADRALANLVWGGLKEESMRDHLFSLSTRRDLISTVAENAIDRWCDGEDDWEVLSKTDTPARCPMEKTFATMLRQSP